MIRWVGFIFIVAGGSAAGILLASSVKKALMVYRQSASALAYMRSEVEFRLTPIDVIALDLSKQLDEPLSGIFIELYRRIHCEAGLPLGLHMHRILKNSQQYFPSELKEILIALFDLMGKQDVAAQVRAITLAEERIAQAVQQIQAEKKDRVRTYRTIGICTSLALAIILL